LDQSQAGGSPPSPEPELPGEFVSEDLRTDCARFINEQRALIALRRELTPENGAWVPRRVSDQPALDE
jgi:hypothetical protein